MCTETDITPTARAAIREYALAWKSLMEVVEGRCHHADREPMTSVEVERRSERFTAAGVALSAVPESERPGELVRFLDAEADSPWSKTLDKPDGPPERIECWRSCRSDLVALGLSME